MKLLFLHFLLEVLELQLFCLGLGSISNVSCEEGGHLFLTHGYAVVPVSFIKVAILSTLDYFGTLVEKQLTMNTRVYFYTVNSIHYSVCLSLFQNHIVFIRVALS